ncbi:MAG: hypothetical protein V4519_01280 [Patescibacteria group bacterium]
MVIVFGITAGISFLYFISGTLSSHEYVAGVAATTSEKTSIVIPTLDKALYNEKMIALANNPAPKISASSTEATSTPPLPVSSDTVSVRIPNKPWPVAGAYPKEGALLPFNRILAYYGNFYSTKMGVLGEYPPDQMLKMLKAEVAKWNAADPSTPAIPAIHYIVTTAQGSPGKDGMYRLRMPDEHIQKAIDLAKEVDGIVFLDVQVGLSNLQAELAPLEQYLKLPNVHLGIDPEFSMKTGAKPGSVIGTFNSDDINYATNFLAKIVKENNLPPKVLVIHRFTTRMVTGSENIKLLPEVQIVMDMDGWGPQAQKLRTYRDIVVDEPVQFTGFKLFYKHDLLPPSTGILTPEQLLKLTPRPIYIQFQ